MGEIRSRRGETALESRWRTIESRIDAAAECLARQGSLASRLTSGGVRVVSVRFVEVVGGRRRQRAIYLGADGELVRRARALIATYRERERWAREVEDAARFTSASSALLRHMLATRHHRSANLVEF